MATKVQSHYFDSLGHLGAGDVPMTFLEKQQLDTDLV
jgi:hypothetical protein